MRPRTAYQRLGAALLAMALGTVSAAAADLGVADLGTPPETAGVNCDGGAVKTFDSVWLGHFTGGYSRKLGVGMPVVLDWRDETLCFPSRHSCDRYMHVMRHDFHRPEGYFTCLPIR